MKTGAQDLPLTLSVVVPLYNEQENIPSLCAQIRQRVAATGLSLQLILVDDGSRDATWTRITEEAQDRADVLAVKLSRNFGKEYALSAGLDQARGDAVLFMDGDLQHPPALIGQMVSAWRDQGAEIVEAVKSSRGREGIAKRLGSAVFFRIFSRLCGFEIKNASDFRLLNRQAADSLRQMKERTLFFRGMSSWIGFTRLAVEFDVPERKAGSSHWGLTDLTLLAINSITAYSSAPLYLVSLAGAAFAVFALLLGAQTLYMFVSGQSLNGFTTVILLVLIVGTVIMCGMSILGLYVSRIYEEVKQRPRYLCSEILDPQKSPIAAASSERRLT